MKRIFLGKLYNIFGFSGHKLFNLLSIVVTFTIILVNSSLNTPNFKELVFGLTILFFLLFLEFFYKKLNQKLLVILIVSVSICIGFYMFGENLKAKWWIIDDHEILTLAVEENFSTDNFVKTYLKTEVSKPGISVRYRPTFF